MQAPDFHDGVHVGRLGVGAKHKAAAVGHIEAVVNGENAETISVFIRLAEIGFASEVDVGVVNQGDTTALQGGQRSCDRTKRAIGVIDALTVFPDDDLAAFYT